MLSRPLSSLQLFFFFKATALPRPFSTVSSSSSWPIFILPPPRYDSPEAQIHGQVDRRQIEPLVLLSSITLNLLFIKYIRGSFFLFLYHSLVKLVLVFPAKHHASSIKWCSFPLWAAPALRGQQAFHVNLKRFHFWGLTATLSLENC